MRLPSRGRGALNDQLRRSSLSVLSNIAEGSGEYRSREKARFYRMAQRSATECAAQVMLVSKLGKANVEAANRALDSLSEVTTGLIGLTRAMEKRGQAEARLR